MHDQVGIATDRRCEVSIGGSRKCEVPLVGLGVTSLAARPQHEVAENALFGLAFNAGSELLIHLRRHCDIFGNLVGACLSAAALCIAAISTRLNTFDRQRTESKRVTKAGSQFFKLNNAARIRLLMDAV